MVGWHLGSQALRITRFSGGMRVWVGGATGPNRGRSVLSGSFPSRERVFSQPGNKTFPVGEQAVPRQGAGCSQGGIVPFPSRDRSDGIEDGGAAGRSRHSTHDGRITALDLGLIANIGAIRPYDGGTWLKCSWTIFHAPPSLRRTVVPRPPPMIVFPPTTTFQRK